MTGDITFSSITGAGEMRLVKERSSGPGSIVTVQLSEGQLIDLIREAAGALETLYVRRLGLGPDSMPDVPESDR